MIAAALCAACGSKTSVSPSETYTGSIVAESFRGTLALGGSAFYSFTAPRDGPITLTLLELLENGVASEATITLGLGVPAGTGCGTGTPVTVPAGATPQVSGTYGAGVYCARVADAGNLTAPARFTVNITRPQ
jgi:hypothetical protein